MIVAGGVYVESCVTPPSRILMGSGGRAAAAASGSGPVSLHTFHPLDQEDNLHANFGPLGIDVTVHPSSGIVVFDYLHPLSYPRISPVPLPHADAVLVRGAQVLRFGCLEGGFVVDAGEAVYDPQNGAAPERFPANGSRADRLALVLNAGEARALTGHDDLGQTAAVLLERERASVVVAKDGPVGAHVFEPGRTPGSVPAYEARGAHKVGSGDVFSATFARLWFSGTSPTPAADAASRHAAHYVSTRILPCPVDLPPMEPRTISDGLQVLVVSSAATTASAGSAAKP